MSSCCHANLPRPSGAIRSGKPHSLCGPMLGICSTNDSGNHSCPKLARSHCGRMPLPCHFCQYIAERVRTEHSTKPGSSGYAEEGQSEEVTLEAARDRDQQLGFTHQISNIHPPPSSSASDNCSCRGSFAAWASLGPRCRKEAGCCLALQSSSLECHFQKCPPWLSGSPQLISKVLCEETAMYTEG